MKRQDFDGLADRLRNWGRWGPEDQRGTLNHIQPATLQAAAQSVRSGKAFSLGLRFDENGPQLGPSGPTKRSNPVRYVTELNTPINPESPSAVWSDDVILMHLQCATHWDALSHNYYDGMLYNGCKACDTLSLKGASKLGVESLASPGIVSRGILLDIARMKGVDELPSDYVITVDDLNEACEREGVSPGRGDIVLVRTGHIRRITVHHDNVGFMSWHAGLGPECAEWIHDKSLAAIAADNLGVETLSLDIIETEMPAPLHMLCLREMGCPLGELFDMEALSVDCAADGQYTFMLSAPPLAITGAFGSPVNPVALK